MCSLITATANINGTTVSGIKVVNPGDWFGKCWLIEIGGSCWPVFIVVEADNPTDAIDELADSETHNHHVVVPDADLGDYPEDERHYGPNGQVIDLDHVIVHGQEGVECPFPCLYHGKGLPEVGVEPTDYWQRDDN